MKRSLATALSIFALIIPIARAEPESPAHRDQRMAWWREAKFGMFIHWGVYSVPARGSEWVLLSEKIPVADYRKFARDFDPAKYDPASWVDLAKQAGMRYMVITAKHHEGFALFPSAASEWNISSTPYPKDLLEPLVTAARDKGMKIGFYYSQAQDWIHRGGAKAGYDEGGGWDDEQKGSFDDYLKTIAVPQTRELITRYQPDIFWWDTPIWMTEERAKPLAEILKLQPAIISNDRLGGYSFPGDTRTPEQFVPLTGYAGDWETCMTIGRSWGYVADDQADLKPAAELIRKLAEICSKGGNFLLNIGPKPDGTIPAGLVQRLKEVGTWMRSNGDSIHGTTAGPFHRLSWGCATRKRDRLYLHVFKWPADGALRVPLGSGVIGATLLASQAAELPITKVDGGLTIRVPKKAPDPVDSVIVLRLSEGPKVAPLPSAGSSASASASQPGHEAALSVDGAGDKCWLAPKEEKSGWLALEMEKPATISAYGFDEPDVWPRMSQDFIFQAEIDGVWKDIEKGKTSGHGRVADFTPVTAKKFRLMLHTEKSSPGVAEFQLYSPE